jgi:hypothetical protein
METNLNPRRCLILASLTVQAVGFCLLGVYIALRGGPDAGSAIAAILAILIGTVYFAATLLYWKHGRRCADLRQWSDITVPSAAGRTFAHY